MVTSRLNVPPESGTDDARSADTERAETDRKGHWKMPGATRVRHQAAIATLKTQA